MTTTPNLIDDKWEIVQHNWHETSINATENQQRICKLDTEDWEVNEDNQYNLENIQLQVARVISAGPHMLKLLQALEQSIMSGNIQVDENTKQSISQVILKATKE